MHKCNLHFLHLTSLEDHASASLFPARLSTPSSQSAPFFLSSMHRLTWPCDEDQPSELIEVRVCEHYPILFVSAHTLSRRISHRCKASIFQFSYVMNANASRLFRDPRWRIVSKSDDISHMHTAFTHEAGRAITYGVYTVLAYTQTSAAARSPGRSDTSSQ